MPWRAKKFHVHLKVPHEKPGDFQPSFSRSATVTTPRQPTPRTRRSPRLHLARLYTVLRLLATAQCHTAGKEETVGRLLVANSFAKRASASFAATFFPSSFRFPCDSRRPGDTGPRLMEEGTCKLVDSACEGNVNFRSNLKVNVTDKVVLLLHGLVDVLRASCNFGARNARF